MGCGSPEPLERERVGALEAEPEDVPALVTDAAAEETLLDAETDASVDEEDAWWVTEAASLIVELDETSLV